MPTVAQIRQFIVGTIIPPIAGVVATWVVGTHVLDLFNISSSEVAYEITQIATFAVVTGLTWATNHKILTGAYLPTAKK